MRYSVWRGAFAPLQKADICAEILAIYAGNPDNFVLLR